MSISSLPSLNNCTVAVIGLGYVGLPLAVEFAKQQNCHRTGDILKRRVIGFDINQKRLEELALGFDRTKEICREDLMSAELLEFTSKPSRLAEADVFVVTVPTPIDCAKRPDLKPLQNASSAVGLALQSRISKSTPIIIYESTVYPGATEEVCVPILERESRLKLNEGFFCGYSPERINPGDKKRTLTNIQKVTSGSTSEAALWVDNFYASIIKAGTYLAPSIKVAEASKVIENTQRDLNIALANELSIIFRHLGIDTLDVLKAAGTKWNFLPFRPGLVGGHCIGVDPYYLTYKAEQVGYYPQVVLSGRRINDGMGRWIVEQTVLELARRGAVIANAQVLVLGFSFKENCPDTRNTRVLDMINAFCHYSMETTVVDPCVDREEALAQYDLDLYSCIPEGSKYSAVIAAVAHDEFMAMSEQQWAELLLPNGVLVDIKGLIPRSLNAIRF